MVRKRKKIEEEKPWCFYCDREFNDESDLILHQKTKHFKCSVCNKKLSSVKALAVHAMQVHKISITEVEGAKPGREDISWEIFGSVGIPHGMQRGQDPPAPSAAAPANNMMMGPPPPYMMGPPPPHMMGMMHQPPPYGGYAPPPYNNYGPPPPQHMPYPGGPPPPGYRPMPPHPHYPGGPPPPGYRPMPPPPGGYMMRPPHLPPTPLPYAQQPVLSSGPSSTVASQQTVPTTATSATATAAEDGPVLVWKEEAVSMEERRASLPRYQQQKKKTSS